MAIVSTSIVGVTSHDRVANIPSGHNSPPPATYQRRLKQEVDLRAHQLSLLQQRQAGSEAAQLAAQVSARDWWHMTSRCILRVLLPGLPVVQAVACQATCQPQRSCRHPAWACANT